MRTLVIQIFSSLLLLGLALQTGQCQGFVHPGGLFKMSDLERMRFQVQAGIEPWRTSFLTLSNQSGARYNYTVRGNPAWTTVSRDPCINCGAFESDANAAYFNALMWMITQDTRHADKCVQIFNAWTNLTDFRGGGTEPLNAGLFAWKMVEAAEIIQSTYPGWSASEIEAFKNMLVYPGYSSTAVPATLNNTNGTFYWRIYRGDPGRHGNQDLIAWRAMISLGVFLDNQKIYDRALNYFKGLPGRPDDIPMPTGPSPSGNQISDNQYFTAYQYLGSQGTIPNYGYNGVLQHYVWENGQNQESSRDQQHAFFGLGICAGIAEVAWNQGDPVWNSLTNRLLKGFEFMSRYNTSYVFPFPDQPEPWEPDNFIQRKDRTGRWFSKKINPYFESNFTNISRGNFAGGRPVYEQAVAHFDVRMGLADQAVWTIRGRDVAITLSGYETTGWSLDHPGWGALTFRRPPLCAGDPISGFSNNVPVFAVHKLPGTIPAENYDYFPDDGNNRVYYDLSSGNSGGEYRNNDVDIALDPQEGFYLTDLENGEWITYTVNVPATGSYHIRARYAAATDAGAIQFSFGTNNSTGELPLPATDGMTNWSTQTLATSVPLNAGIQALRVSIAGASRSFNLKSIAVIAAAVPPTVTATASNAAVFLSWTETSEAATYLVQRATSVAGPYVAIATNDSSTAFLDTGLNNGTTYHYKVLARDADGEPLAESSPVAATPADLTSQAIWTRLTAGNASGGWGVAGNWLNNTIAAGQDITANFSQLNITAASTVTLDAARTVGHLIFGDVVPSHDWFLNTGTGGALTLNVNSGAPTINVNSRTTTIGAVIAGNSGLLKTGAGTLVLTNTANSFSGNITVTQGVLRAGNALASAASRPVLGAASSAGANILTVNSGATFQLAANNQINNKQLYLNGAGSGETLGALYVDATGTQNGTRWGVGGSADPYVTLQSDAVIRVDGTINSYNDSAFLIRSVNSAGFTLTKTGNGMLTLDQSGLGFTGNGHLKVSEGAVSVIGGAITGTTQVTVDSGAQLRVRNNNALNSTSSTLTINGTLDLNNRNDQIGGFTQTIGALHGSGTITHGLFANDTATTFQINGNAVNSFFDGVITVQIGTLNLVKGGNNSTLTLGGNNSYNGTTVVNAGTLLVHGTHAGGAPYTVNSGATLGGVGEINAPVTIAPGATLSPGAGIGTLTIGGNLDLNGNALMEVDTSAVPSHDSCVVAGTITSSNTGTIQIANLGPPLAAGDTFQLFNKAVGNGATLAITPALPNGLVWTNRLALDGSVAVISTIATTPTNISYAITDGTLTLTWPESHIGWQLESQTNSPGAGIGMDWHSVADSITTNIVTFPLNPGVGSVFFRLTHHE